MRTFSTILSAVFVGVLAGIAPADAERSGDEPAQIHLTVGETFDVCKSGEIICPATAPICDDPKVSVPTDTAEGLGFLGVGPGTTLCSAASATGQRRVFRITVR